MFAAAPGSMAPPSGARCLPTTGALTGEPPAYGRIDAADFRLGSARAPEPKWTWHRQPLQPGPELTGAEVRYLMAREWARFPDDILWRRSKLGLTMPQADREALAAFMATAP